MRIIFEEGRLRRLGLEYQKERAKKRHQFGVASADVIIYQNKLQRQPLCQESKFYHQLHIQNV